MNTISINNQIKQNQNSNMTKQKNEKNEKNEYIERNYLNTGN